MPEQQQLLLAKADRGQTLGIDTQVHEIGLGALSTSFTEGKVIFLRSPGIAVSLDSDIQLRVFLNKIRVGFNPLHLLSRNL